MKNLLVCLGFLWGCGGEKDQASDEASADEEYSGEQLIEMYHTANCNLFSDISCLEEMLGCASAVVGYNDWGQCMNTQSTYTNCAHMPGLFLDNSEQVLACVEQIEGADCTASQLCQGGEVVTEAGPCNSVVELIMQNCGPY